MNAITPLSKRNYPKSILYIAFVKTKETRAKESKKDVLNDSEAGQDIRKELQNEILKFIDPSE